MQITVDNPFSLGRFNVLELDEVRDYPSLARILEIWQSKCGEGLPAGIDPFEIPKELLPYVMLLDYLSHPETLRVRLAGTEICERHGGELRGKTTDEIFRPEDSQLLIAAAREVVSTRQPMLAAREDFGRGEWHQGYVRLQLPFSRNGEDVDLLMNVVDPTTLRSYRVTTAS